MNKYEMVLIAAREARRMNDIARLSGSEFTVRPTTVAWQRLMDGKLDFTYEPVKHEPKPVEAPDLTAAAAETAAAAPAGEGDEK